MKNIKSISGKNIRLTNERWMHIIEGHPEMMEHLDNVLRTVTEPQILLKGNLDEVFAVSIFDQHKYLIVIYKETEIDGFILTAYFTSQINKFLKREILWQK